MRAIDLDYQPRRPSAAGFALLLAGSLAVLVAGDLYRQAAAAVLVEQDELARLQAAEHRNAPPRRTVGRNAEDQLQPALEAAAGVAAEIRRPWEALFAALERAGSADIALLEVAPDSARGHLGLSGEARRRAAILAYGERLEASPVLRHVVLVEDHLQPQDPERPFRFQLSAEWVGASLPAPPGRPQAEPLPPGGAADDFREDAAGIPATFNAGRGAP